MIHVKRMPIGTQLACAAALALAGCASVQTAPSTTKTAVPEAPCRPSIGPRPAYPADALTGAEDIFTLGTTLWADRKARRARELELETAIEGCGKPAP